MKHAKGELTIPLEKVPLNVASRFKKEINEAFAEKQRQVAKTLDSQKKQEFERLLAAGKKEQAAILLAQNAKQAAKQEQEKKEAYSKKAALYPGYNVFEVSVATVLKEGILADKLVTIQQRGPVSRLQSVGGGGSNMSFTTTEKSGNLVFIKGEFNGAFDNQRLWVEGYPVEAPYTIGNRTFQQWQQIPPQPSH